jgi:predicted anti-sigma-YlaC factor YlaD
MTGFPNAGVSRVEVEMNCRKAQKKLSKYFDRGLEPDRRLTEHINHCPNCEQFWHDLSILKTALSDLPSPQAPGDLLVRVKAAIRKSQPARPLVLRPVLAGAMAMVLALVIGYYAGTRSEVISTPQEDTITIADAFTEYSPGSLWDFELNGNNTN